MQINFEKFNIAHWALIGFICIGLLSSAYAVSPVKSLGKLLPFTFGIFLYYYITLTNWSNERIMKILYVLLFAALILSVYGVIQYIQLMQAGTTGLGLRITSFTTHSNSVAKFLLLFFPTAFILACVSFSWKSRLYFSVMCMFYIAAEVFTISRGAWIALAVSAILLILLLKNYRLLFGLGVLGLLAVVLLPPEIGIERFNSIFSLTHQWNVERVNVWLASIEMFKDNPILGLGLNNFQYHYLAYKPSYGEEIFAHAHNTFLNLLVETGFIGLSFFLIFLGRVLWEIASCTNYARCKLIGKSIGIGIISFLVYGFVEYNFNNELQIILFFTLLALARNLILTQSSER